MSLLKRLFPIPSQGDQQQKSLHIDHFTKTFAVALSRRSFLKQILVGGTIVGFRLFDVQLAAAASCNYCASSCHCSVSVTCCSPNGLYCYFKSCSLGSGCVDSPPLARVYAYINACDDGTKSHGCGTCFF